MTWNLGASDILGNRSSSPKMAQKVRRKSEYSTVLYENRYGGQKHCKSFLTPQSYDCFIKYGKNLEFVFDFYFDSKIRCNFKEFEVTFELARNLYCVTFLYRF